MSVAQLEQVRRILCVDAHQDTCRIIVTFLSLWGYEVTSRFTATESLEEARLGGYCLYILDACVLDQSGVELCKQIREFDPTTPVLFLSDTSYERDIEAAREAGAQAYLIQPIDGDSLLETVNLLVEGAEATKTLVEA